MTLSVAMAAAGLVVVPPSVSAVGDANQGLCSAQTEASPGFRTDLPDCRAYELVTPPFKFGALVQQSLSPPFLDDSHLKTASIGAFGEAGADPGTEGASYVLYREGGGWSASALNLPLSQFGSAANDLETPPVADVSRDFATTLVVGRADGAKVVDPRFYLRQAPATGGSCPPGSVAVERSAPPDCATEVGPAVPRPAVEAWKEREQEVVQGGPDQHPLITYRGGSRDLTHLLFASQSPVSGEPDWLWPGDTTVNHSSQVGKSLYEYVGTHQSAPTLVGRDNAGQPLSQCGVSLGSYANGREAEHAFNAVSAAGTTVFLSAPNQPTCSGVSPAVGQLFARVGDPGSTQTSINLAGKSSCAASIQCDVTAQPVFQGASSDGSKAFFTTTQPLSPGDLDTSTDIYECELPGDGAATPTPTPGVNPCPVLRPISVSGSAAGADVQSVAAISEDGSHVYFTAEGVLTSVPNQYGATPVLGASNLYAYEHDSRFPIGHIAFVGQTSSEPRAEATPDGRFLLFASANRLTPDAAGESQQLYRYDAQEAMIVRISRGESALDNQSESEFSIPTPDTTNASKAGAQRAAISDDGQYVFFESITALTEHALNRQVVGCEEEAGGVCFSEIHANNVYEYHNGRVYLISDGQDRHVTLGSSTVSLIGASHDGHDVYFRTADQLTPQDTDTQVDIYDARIGGGFPGPPMPATCTGGACQANQSAPPDLPVPGSSSFAGPGNASPPAGATTNSKPLTRPQLLARALATCRHKPKHKRVACERQARHKYGGRSAGRHRTANRGSGGKGR